MLIPFIKMQAQGNDFVIWDMRSNGDIPELVSALSIAICDRRFGVGADGLVIIRPSTESDARMIIYNSDGSRAAMCGSALRCVASLVSPTAHTAPLSIATDSGIKTANVNLTEVVVDMGTPRFVERNIYLHGLLGNVVDTGNLHFVCITENLEEEPHKTHGHLLENDPTFPQGLNSQFAHITGKNELELLIWERGAGATHACGTGAVATVFSGVRSGLLIPPCIVDMPGGRVRVTETPSGTFTLAGEVQTVFRGEYQWRI